MIFITQEIIVTNTSDLDLAKKYQNRLNDLSELVILSGYNIINIF